MLSLLFPPSSSFSSSSVFSTPLECLVTQKWHWSIYFFFPFFFFFSSLSFKEWHQERRRNAWQLPRRLRSWLSEVQRLLKCRLRARRKRRHQNVTFHTLFFIYLFFYQVIDTEPERCCWEMDGQIDGLSLLWYVCNVVFTNPTMVWYFSLFTTTDK